MRPEWTDVFKNSIEDRKSPSCNCRIDDKAFSQDLPSKKIATEIHNKSRNGGRNVKPMVEKKRHAKNATFRNPRKGMNIKKAKCQDSTSQKSQTA